MPYAQFVAAGLPDVDLSALCAQTQLTSCCYSPSLQFAALTEAVKN